MPPYKNIKETRSCATHLECGKCGHTVGLEERATFCPKCLYVLEVKYDYWTARNSIIDFPLKDRTRGLFRFEELLPIKSGYAKSLCRAAGGTPLVRAHRLGEELGLDRLYIKDDSCQRPSFSYKDRVCAIAVARAVELGDDRIACVSTGNVGNSIAAFAAMAGIKAYVFYPNELEAAKAKICSAYGATVIQLDGNYDEANRACKEFSADAGIEFANISLRPFYSEGAKTLAYEICEQLLWKAPHHILLPAAGGTVSSRVHKGLLELEETGMCVTGHTKISIAQPAMCAPIAAAIISGADEIEPVIPFTAAHSLAIGSPGDAPLVIDAVRSRNGTAETATDEEIFEGIDLLARTEGIFTEPAGGTTIACLKNLADNNYFDHEESVVAVITGNGLKTVADHPKQVVSYENVICTSTGIESVMEDIIYAREE